MDDNDPVPFASPTTERLAHELVGGDPDHSLAAELTAWLAASSRFRAFAAEHRDKIRKKLRGSADPEAIRDVRAELQTARLLLADRRIGLEFEAYGSGRAGPDFTATFRSGPVFNVEVTRLRGTSASGPGAAGARLLAKLHQLPPSAPNVILIASEGRTADDVDIATATRTVRARADAKDEDFFVRRGFEGTRAFYERFLRLSAVLVWCETATGNERAGSWVNRSARIALPDRAAAACLQCLRADAG